MHTMEAQFHGAANAAALRALHAQQDWSGLLEYALLLAEQEAAKMANRMAEQAKTDDDTIKEA